MSICRWNAGRIARIYRGRGRRLVPVAPRETLRKLSPRQDDQEKAWAVVCSLSPDAQEVRSWLCSAHAATNAFRKARNLEAYPVLLRPLHGFQNNVRPARFRETGMAGSRRHVMRLDQPRNRGAGERPGKAPALHKVGGHSSGPKAGLNYRARKVARS